MADFAGIAQAFITHYFHTFDDSKNRQNLSSLYRPESMLTYEGTQVQGVQNIISQLNKPELSVIKTQVKSVDSQPSTNGGVSILVTGHHAIDNDFDKPLNFSRLFVLMPIPGQPGGFFVYNDVFRISA